MFQYVVFNLKHKKLSLYVKYNIVLTFMKCSILPKKHKI